MKPKGNSTLPRDYMREKEIRAQYEAASAHGDKGRMKIAKGAYKAFNDSVSARGDAYEKIYRLYSKARERGNDYIDLDGAIRDENARKVIDAFRECGVEKFTFSSGWSGAVETAWLFTQNGCRLEGLVEINSQHKTFGSEEYEKIHGYLFSVQ